MSAAAKWKLLVNHRTRKWQVRCSRWLVHARQGFWLGWGYQLNGKRLRIESAETGRSTETRKKSREKGCETVDKSPGVSE